MAGGEFFLVSLTESERGCVARRGESSGRWEVTGEATAAGVAYTSGSTRVASGDALLVHGVEQLAWGAWAACPLDAGAVRAPSRVVTGVRVG